MSLDWHATLKSLLGVFETYSRRATGLHHLMVEVADQDRESLSGPSWFTPNSTHFQFVDGVPNFQKWTVSKSSGMPSVNPSYRAPDPEESFDENDKNVIRDQSGTPRAVAVPM